MAGGKAFLDEMWVDRWLWVNQAFYLGSPNYLQGRWLRGGPGLLVLIIVDQSPDWLPFLRDQSVAISFAK